ALIPRATRPIERRWAAGGNAGSAYAASVGRGVGTGIAGSARWMARRWPRRLHKQRARTGAQDERRQKCSRTLKKQISCSHYETPSLLTTSVALGERFASG